MCQFLGRTIARAIRLTLSILTFIVFAAAMGSYVPVLGGTPDNLYSPPYTTLQISLLCAGIGISPNTTTSYVYWSDLNTLNTCTPGTSIYEYWAKPLGVCVTCATGLCYATPTYVTFQIVMVLITLSLAILLALVQLMIFICCGAGCCKSIVQAHAYTNTLNSVHRNGVDAFPVDHGERSVDVSIFNNNVLLLAIVNLW